MKVRLINKITAEGYEIESLTLHEEYEVIGIEAGSYRIVDDLKQPYLFGSSCFEVSDPQEPSFWICSVEEEGERYCYPEAWKRPGFFEDYFEGVQETRGQFWNDYSELYEKNPRNSSDASLLSRAVRWLQSQTGLMRDHT